LPTSTAIQTGAIYRFGAFELDEDNLSLQRAGEAIALPIKPWNTLLLLAQNARDTVSKAELMDAVWQGRNVTEGVLTQVISRLRTVLGDENQEVIKTVHGIGFRFMLPVSRVARSNNTNVAATPVIGVGSILRDRPLWQLTQALSTSKRTAVWLATRAVDSEQRVFKLAHDGAGLRALKRELSVTRVLQAAQQADGICEVIDADFAAEPFFVELPYFNGGNLVDFFDSHGKLEKSTKLTLLIDIANALANCHAAGIIHGDIKPKNILVDIQAESNFTAKLADFGAAVLLDQQQLKALQLSVIHQTGDVVTDPGGGTLAYAAPELLAGKPASTASDVYAFGVTAFQLLCGEFSRPLSPGWEELIEGALLQSDIAEMCQADAAKRLTTTQIAERLRTLDARHREKAAQEIAAQELQASKQLAMERLRQQELDALQITHLLRRRRLLQGVALALTLALGVVTYALLEARKLSRIAAEQSTLAQKNALASNAQKERADAVTNAVIGSIKAFQPSSLDSNTPVTAPSILNTMALSLRADAKIDAATQSKLLVLIARALHEMGKEQESAENAQFAINLLEKRNDSTDTERAQAYMALFFAKQNGHEGEALSSKFQHYLLLDSVEPQVRFSGLIGLAYWQSRSGKFDDAKASLDLAESLVEITQLEPLNQIDFYLAKGVLLGRLKNCPAAAPYLENALRVGAAQQMQSNPIVVNAETMLATCEIQAEKFDSAIARFERVIPITLANDPNPRAALSSLYRKIAEAYWRAGHQGQAEKSLALAQDYLRDAPESARGSKLALIALSVRMSAAKKECEKASAEFAELEKLFNESMLPQRNNLDLSAIAEEITHNCAGQ
jgi:serine/threonine protein kinase